LSDGKLTPGTGKSDQNKRAILSDFLEVRVGIELIRTLKSRKVLILQNGKSLKTHKEA
jgi:hypothetical protein